MLSKVFNVLLVKKYLGKKNHQNQRHDPFKQIKRSLKDMSTRGLLLQGASTIKPNCRYSTKRTSLSSDRNKTSSRHDMAEKMLHLALNHNHSLAICILERMS